MTLHHQATERKAEGFERRFQQGLEWLSERPRQVLMLLAGGLVVGVLIAGIYEWGKRREGSAQVALARVERTFARGMGDERSAVPVEPANADQARRAREQALAGFELVVREHGGSRAAALAQVRAAEIEVDLGELDAGIARIAAAVSELETDDPLRAVALRLSGYAHELKGDSLGAAEDYAAAAAVESYPGRALLWVVAGESFERGGATDRALDALRQGLASDPVLAEQLRAVQRIEQLEQQLAAQQASAQPPEPAAAEVGGVVTVEPVVAEPAAESAPAPAAAEPAAEPAGAADEPAAGPESAGGASAAPEPAAAEASGDVAAAEPAASEPAAEGAAGQATADPGSEPGAPAGEPSR
jgi:tetratricopeptide (TPR) repeat protein